MPNQAEIDAGARILSKGCWDGCESDGRIEPCVFPPCPCRSAAKEILIQAENVRIEERRRTCQHSNKNGSGRVGSDGSSEYSWYCPDCGMSGHEITPANTAATRPQTLRILSR